MITDITAAGCLIVSRNGHQAGDPLSIDVPGVGPVDAIVVARAGGEIRCRFLTPLDDAALASAAMASARSQSEEVVRWPLPVRAAIAVGGAAALWTAIAVVLL